MSVNLTNITGMENLLLFGNQETGSMFGPVILIILFVVTFFAMKDRFTTSRAFGGSAFLVFVASVFMRMVGASAGTPLVNNYALIVTSVMLLFAIIYLKMENK